MARYRITRHPLVRSDLLNITNYIGEFAGYAIAGRKIAEVRQTIARLADFPHIGTIRSDIHPGLRVIVAAEKGVICFTVDDDTHRVFIIAISYAGADWQTRVGERTGE